MAAVSPKNTGRKVGKVLSVSKNKVRMHFEDTLHPKDILVIPVSKDGQDEVILTVPSKDVGTSLKGQVTLKLRAHNLLSLECLYIAGEMKNFLHTLKKNIFKWRDKNTL